jgi:hypothetical protein
MQVAAACLTALRMFMLVCVMMIMRVMMTMRVMLVLVLMSSASKRHAYDMTINQQQAKRDHHEIGAKL